MPRLILVALCVVAAYDVVIRFTDTFVRRDGRWRAVASHASLVQAK